MDEQLLSNTSYTNKDFRSVYPELLDLVKKLTNKWDPSLSNESDPGVILLKLNALIADKNNYNIDKNVLECFPLSVTQLGNAREIYDSLGYYMHWYRSATTQATIKWIGSKSKSSVIIDRFTMLSNSSKDVVYTITRPVELLQDGSSEVVSVIEGVNYRYNINGETTIKLNNLDADLRLYFDETQIAENGIFVSNILEGGSNYDDWQRVDNLESHPLNQRVYKFGILPNSGVCYIQFPQDIANLIDNGLTIQYIISSGYNGNIDALVLDSFYNDYTVDVTTTDDSGNDVTTSVTINDSVKIINASSALNGSDPEDLDDSYRNYKKTIGTFNTLVTCDDYINAIYNLEDNDHPQYDNIVSNCVVSDRTNDLNNSYYIQVLDELGARKQLVVKRKESGNEPEMTAFDLGLYLLSPMNNTYTDTAYDYSFEPDPTLHVNIATAIDNDYKAVQHDYIDNSKEAVYYFRNDWSIDCKIATYYKVSEVEATQIVNNVRLAIYKNYNARKVNFGVPINYDELLNVIQTADTRIKSLILQEPEYNLKSVSATNVSNNIEHNSNLEKDIIAKSILAGETPLYDFDKRFNYEFGQINSKIHNNIKTITTKLNIDVNTINSVAYTLDKNESIQFIAPKLNTVTDYTVSINYSFSLLDGSEIKKDSDYRLKSGEVLKLDWVSNGNKQTKTYTYPAIIQTTFDVVGNMEGSIGISDSIKIRELSISDLSIGELAKFPMLYCYWITNDVDNAGNYILKFSEPDESGMCSRILKNNEYFMYTDNLSGGELAIKGAGTRLDISKDAFIGEYSMRVPKVDLSTIYKEGTNAFNSNDCKRLLPSSGKIDFSTTDMQIISLGEGTKITSIELEDTTKTTLGNDFMNCSNVTYEIDGESVSLPSIDIGNYSWQVCSMLNVIYDGVTPQTLKSNQIIELNLVNGEIETIGQDRTVQFNHPVFIYGGNTVDVSVLDNLGNYSYTLDCYEYTKETLYFEYEGDYITLDNAVSISNSTITIKTNSNTKFDIVEDMPYLIGSNNLFTQINVNGTVYDKGKITFKYNKKDIEPENNMVALSLNSSQVAIITGANFVNSWVELPFDFIDASQSTEYILPVMFIKAEDGDSIDIGAGYKDCYGESISEITESGTYYLAIADDSSSSFKFNVDNLNESQISIGRLVKRSGLSENMSDDILNTMQSLDTLKLFNFTYEVNSDTAILNPINAISFFEANHIFNRYVLPKFDINSNIQVLKSSKM